MEIHVESFTVVNDMGSDLQMESESTKSRNLSIWFCFGTWVVQIIKAVSKSYAGSPAEEIILFFLWNVVFGLDA